MTTPERIAKAEALLEKAIAELRHTVRHNGAAIDTNADIGQIAAHAMDVDVDRVRAMWMDINTIDSVKNTLYFNSWEQRPDLTTEQLLEYSINDERLVSHGYSWAVVKLTRTGAQLLTYGGNYYQRYTFSPDGARQQEGGSCLLQAALEKEKAAWLADIWEGRVDQSLDVYEESGVRYYVMPCNLPGDLDRLMCIHIDRSPVDNIGSCKPLSYGISTRSCHVHNHGMIGLPHGMWLIYDNSNLVSAPQALLIPCALADGANTGIRFDGIRIVYNALVSGLERLRLVSDAFGEEYIVSTQDFDGPLEGTWKE